LRARRPKHQYLAGIKASSAQAVFRWAQSVFGAIGEPVLRVAQPGVPRAVRPAASRPLGDGDH
jgi:hypothetical protein